MIPADLRYTTDHEWVRATEHGTIVFGITDFAQDALGDIVYVDLPVLDTSLTAGSACGEVESTKSVSEIFAPISGTVVARNDSLDAGPEVINTDPYGAGWMLEVRPQDASWAEGLLDSEAYSAFIAQG